MSEQAIAFVFVLLVASVLGVRASYRLTRRYRGVRELLDERERTVLGTFVVVAWMITFVALVLGLLAARRLFGFEAVPWGSTVTLLLASFVLLIPAGLDYVVERVSRVPWR